MDFKDEVIGSVGKADFNQQIKEIVGDEKKHVVKKFTDEEEKLIEMSVELIKQKFIAKARCQEIYKDSSTGKRFLMASFIWGDASEHFKVTIKKSWSMCPAEKQRYDEQVKRRNMFEQEVRDRLMNDGIKTNNSRGFTMFID